MSEVPWLYLGIVLLALLALVGACLAGISDIPRRLKFSVIGVSILVLAVILVVSAGCVSRPRTGSLRSASDQSASTVSDIGKGLSDSASNIEEYAKAIADDAPERAGIVTETGVLRIYSQRLLSASSDIAEDGKRCAALEREFTTYKTSDARRILQITMGICVVGCIVAFGLLRNLQLGAVCAVGVACCIGGFWLLAYAKIIAIVIAAGMVGLTVYLVWRMIRSSKEIATTAKEWSTIPPDAPWEQFASKANEIQSRFTKRLIDVVQPKSKSKG